MFCVVRFTPEYDNTRLRLYHRNPLNLTSEDHQTWHVQ